MKHLISRPIVSRLPASSTSLTACLAAVVGLMSLGAPAVEASPVSFEFSGVIDVAGPSSDIAAGTPFSGTFTYDPDASTSSAGTESFAAYSFGQPQFGPDTSNLTLKVGGNVVYSGGRLGIYVTDNAKDVLANPLLTPFTRISVDSIDGTRAFSLMFENRGRSVDPTLQLPTLLSLPDFTKATVEAATLELTANPLPVSMTQYMGTIASLTQVPEPSTLALPALVAVGMGVRRYRRRRAGR